MVNTMNVEEILKKGKEEYGFISLKGELEAEGLTQTQVAREAIIAARNQLDYLIKIGGSEAKNNLQYLIDIGVTSVVVPMIETSFAMQKFIKMLPKDTFEHVGVTIETITAVENVDSIIDVGTALTEITIGRSDLTASYNGTDVESEKTINMVKKVARKAKDRGLKVTMGGSVSKNTVQTLITDSELFDLIDFIETRKVVMKVENFIQSGAIEQAVAFELINLENKLAINEIAVLSDKKRKAAISTRI
jgi:4-hydroxy-2-oxoheptanedioate aldolase